MRETKFRAWDKKEKTMDEPFDLYSVGYLNGENGYDPKYYILLEFTGLHDKNGKEIYESDKLKTKKDIVYTIFYSEKTARWAGKTLNVWTDDVQKYFYKSLAWLASRSEVIGDIYSNPELLEEK